MKRIVFIFVFCLLAFSLSAQDYINGKGMGGFTNATTTLERKTAAYSYTLPIVNLEFPYLYTYSVRLQDLGGKPLNNYASSVVISGSLDGYEFKTITTITLGKFSCPADTALIGNITSAPLSYKFIKFTITPVDTIWVKSIYLHILPSK